jgi:S-adenosyl-L-methionine hydrolase (adenosine-forming)
MNAPVVLLTDFGVRDGYDGVLRLVLQKEFPQLTVVDLSHGVSPGDVLGAAYLLSCAVPYAVKGAVYCVVVDPGVGSARALLIARWPTFTLVCPDNGILTLCARLYGMPICTTVEAMTIRDALQWSSVYSSTFHGRDLLAPLAGYLACGGILSEDIYEQAVMLPPFQAPVRTDNSYPLSVLYCDHFGNYILNLHQSEWDDTIDCKTICLHFGDCVIHGIVQTYCEVADGELLLYWGSSGWLELAVRNGSAQKHLGVLTEPILLVLS